MCQLEPIDDPNLIVGFDSSDDAAVYKISDEESIIQTVDLFPPIVDNPETYGAIAAANALSDVYAMGGTPKLALNILCIPADMDKELVSGILHGGNQKVNEAGAVICGGHTIKDNEPKYGLSVTGFIKTSEVVTNSGARPGDVLILTKPIGTGILSTAMKSALLGDESYNAMAASMMSLNGTASRIMGISTAGYPLSAATTTAVCNAFVGKAGISGFYIYIAAIAIITGIIIIVFVRDFPEEKGAFPDNDKDFDFELAKREHEKNLEYLKTSKWTVKKCISTGRMWLLWIAIGINAFLSMGIMSNFVGKFMESGYKMPEILVMLAIAGVAAIPGSIFVGWIDVHFNTKTALISLGIFAVISVSFNLTPYHILHYISLPFLAIMLGGASNMMVSCTSAIWGRYDFQNAFRVIQPLNSIMTGIGITVVGIVGTHYGYTGAYEIMLVLAIIGLLAQIALKVEPIDKDVR